MAQRKDSYRAHYLEAQALARVRRARAAADAALRELEVAIADAIVVAGATYRATADAASTSVASIQRRVGNRSDYHEPGA